MVDQKKSRPRTFGRPEGDGKSPQPRNVGPQAPIAGMFTSSVKSIAAENEALRAERDEAVHSGSMLLELDPAKHSELREWIAPLVRCLASEEAIRGRLASCGGARRSSPKMGLSPNV